MKKILFVMSILFITNSYSSYKIHADSFGEPLKFFLDNIFITIDKNYSCGSELLSTPFYGKIQGTFNSKNSVINTLQATLRANNLRVYNGVGGVNIIAPIDDKIYNDLISIDTIITITGISDSTSKNLDLISLGNSQYRYIGNIEGLQKLSDLLPPIDKKAEPPLTIKLEIVELILDSSFASGLQVNDNGLSLVLGGEATFFNWSDFTKFNIKSNYSLNEVFKRSSVVYNPTFTLTQVDTINLFYGVEKKIEISNFSNDNGAQTEYEYKKVGIDFVVYPYENINNLYKIKISIVSSDFLINENYSNKTFLGVDFFKKGQKKLINSYKSVKIIDENYRVPFLSEIPAFGNLFKGSKKVNNVVYSFVFAEIV